MCSVRQSREEEVKRKAFVGVWRLFTNVVCGTFGLDPGPFQETAPPNQQLSWLRDIFLAVLRQVSKLNVNATGNKSRVWTFSAHFRPKSIQSGAVRLKMAIKISDFFTVIRYRHIFFWRNVNNEEQCYFIACYSRHSRLVLMLPKDRENLIEGGKNIKPMASVGLADINNYVIAALSFTWGVAIQIYGE